MYSIVYFIVFLLFYIYTDYGLGDRIQGKYYLIHSFNNMLIVYFTLPSVLYVYTDFIKYHTYEYNYFPSVISYSLHVYHIVVYYKKLRFDDWAHHIIMMLSFPLAMMINPSIIINHALFYLTGLPGAINYFILFLCRNGFVSRLFQKKVNNYLNLFIRGPGCISHVTICLMTIGIRNYTTIQILILYIQCVIVYWNGIYFMNKVIIDYNKHV